MGEDGKSGLSVANRFPYFLRWYAGDRSLNLFRVELDGVCSAIL